MHITRAMIHPELRLVGTLVRRVFPTFSERAFRRCNALMKPMKGRGARGLRYEQVMLPREDGTTLRLCVYRPPQASEQPLAGVLWLHGGGYGLGIPEQDVNFIRIFTNHGCTVVAPDYCLSVQAPYPAALLDCHAALSWMHEHAEELNVRLDQLMVGGDSAGGGLAAALCIYERDEGGIPLAFQMPLYPMLDDRMITASARDNDAPVWNSASNEAGWKLYLGDLYQSLEVPPTAAPGRLKDFSGLPPAFTYVGTIEPFHDETVAYFENMREAGVQAECHEYEGCFHAFDLFGAKTTPGKEARARLEQAFIYAMTNDRRSDG